MSVPQCVTCTSIWSGYSKGISVLDKNVPEWVTPGLEIHTFNAWVSKEIVKYGPSSWQYKDRLTEQCKCGLGAGYRPVRHMLGRGSIIMPSLHETAVKV